MKFMEDNTDLLRSSEIMMDALPICQIRKISYATFSIVDSELEGKTRIFEMDNPRYIFIRNHRLLAIKGREFSSPKWKERTISVSQITTQPEDRIILMSDGVTQAGLGNKRYPLGWGRQGCIDFVLKEIEKDLHKKGFKYICGIDEAGRGPLAGPVVATAVIMPKNCYICLLYTSPSPRD